VVLVKALVSLLLNDRIAAMTSSKSMPSAKNIYEFWTSGEGKVILDGHGVQVPIQSRISDDGTKLETVLTCFACGDRDVQRCHIFPRSKGGDNTVENLHLLCGKCHVESEYLEGDFYWRWLKHKFDNEWQEFTEHIHDRRVRLGYDQERFYKLLSRSMDEALDYATSFEGYESEEERKQVIERLKQQAMTFSEGSGKHK